MKKLLALVMAILMVFCTFASCGGGSASGNTELPDDEKQQTEDNGQSGNIENDKVAEGDKPTDEGNTDGEKIEDVKAEFNTLNLNGNFATGVVSNSSTDFNFENEISIAEGMDYVVSLDENGTQILTDKQCSLVEGDNTFYIIVSKGDTKATYSITIRRKPMYEVKFNTNGGTDVTDKSLKKAVLQLFQLQQEKDILLLVGIEIFPCLSRKIQRFPQIGLQTAIRLTRLSITSKIPMVALN